MKISARNQFEGTVVSLTEGAVNTEVKIDLGNGFIIASVITKDAVEELGLAIGKPATAIIKASNVLVGA